MKYLKKLKKRLISFIREWFLSERMKAYLRDKKTPKNQKFWMGNSSKRIKASPCEFNFFKRHDLQSFIVSRSDDYRAAAELPPGKKVFNLKREKPAYALQFGVAPKKKSEDGVQIKIQFAGQERIISSLAFEKWIDIRFDCDSELTAQSLIVECDVELFMTMPRFLDVTSKSELKHVFVVVFDAMGSEFLEGSHPFDKMLPLTPNIKKFFSKGLHFPNGISSGGWTLPTVGSLFTGDYVAGHLMFSPTAWSEFSDRTTLISEHFQQKGYHSILASCVSRINPSFGHLRGFDRFLYHFPNRSEIEYDARIWVDELVSHVDSHRQTKTFNYFQFPDTHPSWDQSPQTRALNLGRRGSSTANFGDIAHGNSQIIDLDEQTKQIYQLRIYDLDRQIGNLFSYLNNNFSPEEFLVILTADHGVRMPHLDESYTADKAFLTKVRVNIPTFIKSAKANHQIYGKYIEPNVDIAQTLLSLVSPSEKYPKGISLFVNDELNSREFVLSESIHKGEYELAIRSGNLAYFEKYKIDEKKMKLLSEEPYWFLLKDEVLEETLVQDSNLLERFKKRAEDHYYTYKMKNASKNV